MLLALEDFTKGDTTVTLLGCMGKRPLSWAATIPRKQKTKTTESTIRCTKVMWNSYPGFAATAGAIAAWAGSPGKICHETPDDAKSNVPSFTNKPLDSNAPARLIFLTASAGP